LGIRAWGIEQGTEQEKIIAARKINAEARTKTHDSHHYLYHPRTTQVLIDALEKESSSKVYLEILWALVFICNRHLPDIRVQKYFLAALDSKKADMRWLGVMGLENLYKAPMSRIEVLAQDRSRKVREVAESLMKRGEVREFPSWMFSRDNFKKEKID
jgi:hypothetical protein